MSELIKAIEEYLKTVPAEEKEIFCLLSKPDHLYYKESIIMWAHHNRPDHITSKLYPAYDLLKANVFSLAISGRTIHFSVGPVTAIGILKPIHFPDENKDRKGRYL